MRKYLVNLVFPLIFFLLVGCTPRTPVITVTPKPGYWPTDSWRTSIPEQQGMDSAKLAEMFERIQAQQINLHSLIVIRNGYIVAEAYFDPYTPQIRHQAASLTKSMIGALVGIAIEQGKIRGVNQKVLDFFPDRRVDPLDARKQSITLENLLSLSSGLDLPDFTSRPQMEESPDWVQFTLDLPMAAEPGTCFGYGNAPVHLLSAILQKTTGEEARLFANQFLFEPLGISPVTAQEWSADPQGVTSGGIGLHLTPRELAKFAYLYLKQGDWAGKQVVPTRWVTDSLSPHIAAEKDPNYGNQERQYGYLWSIFPGEGYYAAFGMGGQHLYILPEQNIVAVFTGGLHPDQDHLLIQLVNEAIIPAAKSTVPLSANPQATAKLEALVQRASRPIQPVAALNDTAQQISGKTYLLKQNPNNWKEMTLTFSSGSGTAILKMDAVQAQIGLDNLYRVTAVPGSGPLVLKGRWDGADTFVIDALNLGEVSQVRLRAKYSGNTMTVSFVDSLYDSTLFSVIGFLKE